MGAHGLATLVRTAASIGRLDFTVLVQLLAWQANKKMLLVEEVQEAYRGLMEQVRRHSGMKDKDFSAWTWTLGPEEIRVVPGLGTRVTRQQGQVEIDRRQYFQDL